MIRVISFDLDGTLASEDFDGIIWNEEIPKLFAEKYRLSIEQAKTHVYAEYYRALYIENIPNWTDIDMWFRRFGLSNYKELMEDLKHKIVVYDDTIETLKELGKDYKLVIISLNSKQFFDFKLELTGLKKYFDEVFSSSMFNTSKKDEAMYRQTLALLHVKPEEVIHVGNEWKNDYEAPSHTGIKAFIIDRSGKTKGEHVIRNLRELKEKLKELK